MARSCTICNHSDRSSIESAIVASVSLRDIARQYGVSKDSLSRHSAHITEAIKASQEAKEEAQALDVVRQLQEINAVAIAIMKESRKNGKNGTALFAIDRIQKQLELQAKLLGDIDEGTTVTIWMAPEWQSIRTLIVQALAPYPDARIAVATALSHMENARDRLN